jgi:hypothetical protein
MFLSGSGFRVDGTPLLSAEAAQAWEDLIAM